MSKRGATKTGGNRSRARDSERVKYLSPSPKSWNKHPTAYPYHNNAGKRSRKFPS